MHPLFYRKNYRTGLCAGLILLAATVRLAAVPGLPQRAGDSARDALRSGAFLRTVIFLETGARIGAGDGGRETEDGRVGTRPYGAEDGSALASGDPSSTASGPPSPHLAEDGEKALTGDGGPGTEDEGRETGDEGRETGDTSFVTLRVPPSPRGEGFAGDEGPGTGDEGRETGDGGHLIRHGEAVTPSPQGEGFAGDEGPGTEDEGRETGDEGPGTGDTSFVTLRVPPSPRGEGFTGDEGPGTEDEGRETGDAGRETGDEGRETEDGRVGTRPYGAGFSDEEAQGITLRGNCSYEVDKAALLTRPLGWETQGGPQVLILHTHSCESYTPTPGFEYEADGNFRTLDKNASVIAVGDRLTEALEARGVEVIHDRTYNDSPSYNQSYAVAREKIQNYLAEYSSIRLVIDLHRDAMAEPVREATEIDGQAVAKLMFVVGTDEGGLWHPHWKDNLSCALKLQALTNRSAPGLCKDLSFRRERFNGDLCPGEMIVEVGSTGNSLPEAIAAMPYLAQSIAELLETE